MSDESIGCFSKTDYEHLQAKHIPIYSISRLNIFDNCKYEYYLNYIKKEVPRLNIYSFLGSKVHECLEQLQNGKEVNFIEKLQDGFNEADFLDIEFPSENIKVKWENNILAFARDYHPIQDKKTETEKWFLISLGGYYLQGFIDLLIYNEDGTVSIVDYKTSTKYTNKDLQQKGRQLVLYGIAAERLGYKVKDIAWNFLKYVNVSYKLKNGKTKVVVAERGSVVDKLKSDIQKEMKNINNGLDDLQKEMLIEQASLENSFEKLPPPIKEKYTFSDCLIYYDFNEESKKETQDFIISKIQEIENMENSNDEDLYEPREILPYDCFYCQNLCSHANNCDNFDDFVGGSLDKIFG